MKIYKTEIEVGTPIKIQGVTGNDSYLNELTGIATNPFGIDSDGTHIGVWCDNFDKSIPPEQNVPSWGICNVKITEFVKL